jgi:phosphatidate phosphatase PAH1
MITRGYGVGATGGIAGTVFIDAIDVEIEEEAIVTMDAEIEVTMDEEPIVVADEEGTVTEDDDVSGEVC